MERLGSPAELLARSGDDPWIRWGAAGPDERELWVHRDIALIERTGERRGFWVLPLRQPDSSTQLTAEDEADRFRAALTTLRNGDLLDRVDARSLTVDAAYGAIAHQVFALGDGGDWEWMWTVEEPPQVGGEDRVIPLDDTADAHEINTFSAAHNHRPWTRAGTGRVVRWLGIRDRYGDLLAVGGSEREDSGAPHLAGIVTHTAHRGEGLGSAVSTGLVRWALKDSAVCTLGMYTDNAAARSVYRRIGFATARGWQYRPLLDAAAGPGS